MEIEDKIKLIDLNDLLRGIRPCTIIKEIEHNIRVNNEIAFVRSKSQYFNENTSFMYIFLYDSNEFPLGFLYYNLDNDCYIPYLTNDNVSIEDDDYVRSCMRILMRLENMK